MLNFVSAPSIELHKVELSRIQESLFLGEILQNNNQNNIWCVFVKLNQRNSRWAIFHLELRQL